MKILNQTNLDELIRRSADREVLRQDPDTEEGEEFVGDDEEVDEMQWQAWMDSVGW